MKIRIVVLVAMFAISLSNGFAQSTTYHAGSIVLTGSGTGVLTLVPPATGSTSYTWPAAYPASDGYILSSTAGGSLSWIPASTSFTPAYLYAASTTTQTVPLGSTLSFTGGTITESGITGSSTAFTTTASGVYLIEFDVSVQDANISFGISVNGTLYAPSQTYGTASANPVVHGRAIIHLNAGDVIGLFSANTTASVSSAYTGCLASMTALRIQ